MKKALTVLALTAALACATDNTPPFGSWSASGPDWNGRVRLTILRSTRFSRYQSTLDYDLSALPGLSSDDVRSSHRVRVHFALLRDAGSLLFDGEFFSGAGSGLVTFKANHGFTADLDRMGIARATDDQLLEMTLEDIGLDYIKTMHKAMRPLTVDDIFNLRHHGVTAEYVVEAKAAGYRDWTASDFAKVRDHGASASFLVDLTKAGYNPSADDVTKLRDHGVPADFLAQAKRLGYALSAGDAVTMHDHGVDGRYLADLGGAGPKLQASEIVKLRDNGVRADFFRSVHSTLGASVDDAIRLRNNGLPADVAAAYRASGYNCSIDDMIQLHNNGVTPQFATDVSATGFGPVGIADLINLRNNGVDAAYLRKVRMSGLKNLTVAQVIRLHQNGVD
jgi:hypothetical protein